MNVLITIGRKLIVAEDAQKRMMTHQDLPLAQADAAGRAIMRHAEHDADMTLARAGGLAPSDPDFAAILYGLAHLCDLRDEDHWTDTADGLRGIGQEILCMIDAQRERAA